MTATLTKRDLRDLAAKGCIIGPPPRLPSASIPPPNRPPLQTAQATAGRSWTLRIPGWRPTPLNRLLGHWAKGARRKKADAEMIVFAVMMGGIPAATEKRTVRLHVVWGPGQRKTDKDSFAKSLLDALQLAGAIRGDSERWVSFPEPTYSRGDELVTFITIEE